MQAHVLAPALAPHMVCTGCGPVCLYAWLSGASLSAACHVWFHTAEGCAWGTWNLLGWHVQLWLSGPSLLTTPSYVGCAAPAGCKYSCTWHGVLACCLLHACRRVQPSLVSFPGTKQLLEQLAWHAISCTALATCGVMWCYERPGNVSLALLALPDGTAAWSS